MDISDWRSKIDAVDTAMLHLMNLRAGFALEVARLKGQNGLSLRTPERERQIVERMQGLNPGPLDGEAIAEIYGTIVGQCIRAQERDQRQAGAQAREPQPLVAKGKKSK
jgi:chorismate mutase/prephenate dehydratase